MQFQTAYKKHDKYETVMIDDPENEGEKIQAIQLTEHGKNIVTTNTKPSMTKESIAEELDVNNIVRRYQATGVLKQAHDFEGIYGDFTSMDMREAITKVDEAREIFMQVPSSIRGQFDNDAGAFIDYATNADNYDQMVEWGLANPPPREPEAPAPVQVEVVNQTSE